MENALNVINEITNHGFEAYIVGGFVRDYLLGKKTNDVDITTNATPREIRDIFKDDCLPGEDYGCVVVIKKNIRYEITTYRRDIGSINNRKPVKVEYINNLEEDLLRRDFTINTICIDKNGNIVDLLNGRKDLDNKIIRCVGKPDDKFKNDALRMLRCIRFSGSLEFDIDEDIKESIIKNKKLIRKLSYTRKKEELDKIFSSSNAIKSIQLLLDYKLDKELDLKNLERVKIVSSPLSVWSIIDYHKKYPFTNNEKEMIRDIKKVMTMDNIDSKTLYLYGLYVNSIAGELKGLDIKNIAEAYVSLPIKNRKDINIETEDIIKLLDKKPGKYLKDILDDIEIKILYGKIENDKDKLLEYIKENYKK